MTKNTTTNSKKSLHKKNSNNKSALKFAIILFLCLIFLTSFQNINNKETLEIRPYFCQKSNCEQILNRLINNSNNSIQCAFYDLDLDQIINTINKKIKNNITTQIIIDDKYIKNKTFHTDNKSSYMHNKFCILDKKILITGSMNPTFNGAYKNDNNILIIKSRHIIKNYLEEFNEMYNENIYSAGKKTTKQFHKINNTIIGTLFCPEDNCIKTIANLLYNAKKSIYFLTFSFTHETISSILVNKNLEIKGVIESRQANGLSSQYQFLKSKNIDVHLDKNPNMMHHKIFIIDNETIITGSMNPSKNGDQKNDENVIIIKNKEIAKKYLEEFFRII